ncbi:helix-turn-helix domain-containing protein [Sinorhizobium medicae]|nr:helix-turn-helix domain-containing protein [Sinorhizobium medicae]
MPVGTDSVVASFPTVSLGTPPMRREPSQSEVFQTMLECLRVDHQMSLGDIARESGVSKATVHRLTVGDSRQPSWETGHRIEKLFREKRR